MQQKPQKKNNTSHKICIVNDTHAGARRDSPIFRDYQESFYKDIFFPYLKKNHIKTIFHLGDAFENRKEIDVNTLNAHRKMFLEPLVENDIQMIIIPGNHDTYFKSTNKINTLKEVFGYFTDNVRIIENPMDVNLYGTVFGFVPWINQENSAESIEFITKKSKASILLGHFELNGFEMQKGILSHADGEINSVSLTETLNTKYEMVLSGHYHHKSNKGNIYYLGTQYEITWADCDDPKYFHEFDCDNHLLTPIRNPYTIHKKIEYRNNEIPSNTTADQYKGKYVRVNVRQKNDPFMFDKFIQKIESFEPLEVKIADYSLILKNNDDDSEETDNDTTSSLDELSWKDTISFAHKHIDQSIDETTTHIEKTKLKNLFNELFNEVILNKKESDNDSNT